MGKERINILKENGANPDFYEIIDAPIIHKNNRFYQCETTLFSMDFVRKYINNTKNMLTYYIYDINKDDINKNIEFIRFFTINDNKMKTRIEKVKKIKNIQNDR